MFTVIAIQIDDGKSNVDGADTDAGLDSAATSSIWWSIHQTDIEPTQI